MVVAGGRAGAGASGRQPCHGHLALAVDHGNIPQNAVALHCDFQDNNWALSTDGTNRGRAPRVGARAPRHDVASNSEFFFRKLNMAPLSSRQFQRHGCVDLAA